MSFQGFPVIINAPRSESDVIKWVLESFISREAITIIGGGADAGYEIGTVFGQITVGAQTVGAATANAGNVTNATVSTPTATATALAGPYKVIGISAGATGGFMVYRPDGTLDGIGKVGTAYVGSVGFTVTDGSTHLAVEDGWTIPVSYAAGSMKYAPLNLTATDGSQISAAILYSRTFVPLGVDTEAGAVVRDAVIIPDPLIWPSGITTDQITAGLAQLKTHRIYTKTLA
jgi:hypothetical protein